MLGSVTNGDCADVVLKSEVEYYFECSVVLLLLISVSVSILVPEGSHMGSIVQFLFLVGF